MPHQELDPLASVRAQSLGDALRDAGRKQAFVTPMFDVIAPRYDDFTRWFSFGMDAGWKQALLTRALASVPHVRRVVDAATGTGDLAAAVANRVPHVEIVGIDPSREMLRAATARHASLASRVHFVEGRLESMPVATAQADLLTAGYGFRNVADLDAALRESARILRPGGILASLDFHRPHNALWRRLFLGYLRASGNAVGWWWHRTPAIYGYIAASIETWCSATAFAQRATRHGFRVVEIRERLFGGVAIVVLQRTE
jgi:demethylmenaquinone methyltransferase / 2-methoxy-6-polyprenyl-1,4-benzoquinol methylase